MSLYAIGDLHLSFSAEKTMDVFGGAWENYVEKLQIGFSGLRSDDVCVICGDISWAMSLADAGEDFRFISELPGRKIILKGNHDYWWSTASKASARMQELGIENISFLHNNCYFYGESAAICGTRGWFFEEERGNEHDRKMLSRELMRLEVSLKAAGERDKYVFLHYPPKYGRYVCGEMLSLLQSYNVRVCAAGHLHGAARKFAFEGEFQGTQHLMVSADHVNFTPVKILD